MHFKEGMEIIFEILRRMELFYFFRYLFKTKGYGKLNLTYSDYLIQPNKLFIISNFYAAQKIGYLPKKSNSFLNKNKFTEKLIVLSNVGLLYFNEPSLYPKKLIPIIGSEITLVADEKYNKKFCFEIKTINGFSCVFSSLTSEERYSWLMEFSIIQNDYQNRIKSIDCLD